MELTEEIYSETGALIQELIALDKSRWLRKFKAVFEGGASGREIMLGIRWNLRQMLDSGELEPPLHELAEKLLAKVGAALE